MEFESFNSILSESVGYRAIHSPEYYDSTCIVTEKIHGANFSIYILNNGTSQPKIQYASRKKILKVNDPFFNYKNFFNTELESNLKKIYKSLKIQTNIRFIGEIFGGGIQKEIDYGELDFNFFHMQTSNDNIVWDNIMDWGIIENYSKQFNLKLVPNITFGKFTELYGTLDPKFQSKLNSNVLCEGLVFRVTVGTDLVFFKKRNQNFLEVKMSDNKNKNKNKMSDDILACATKQRIINTQSKHGFEGIKNLKVLVELTIEDIEKECEIMADKETKQQLFRILAPLTKEILQ